VRHIAERGLARGMMCAPPMPASIHPKCVRGRYGTDRLESIWSVAKTFLFLVGAAHTHTHTTEREREREMFCGPLGDGYLRPCPPLPPRHPNRPVPHQQVGRFSCWFLVATQTGKFQGLERVFSDDWSSIFASSSSSTTSRRLHANQPTIDPWRC